MLYDSSFISCDCFLPQNCIKPHLSGDDDLAWLVSLIEACWAQEPEARPSMQQILATLSHADAEVSGNGMHIPNSKVRISQMMNANAAFDSHDTLIDLQEDLADLCSRERGTLVISKEDLKGV